MDIYGLVLSIIESQGLVAGLLVYLIIQNDREKGQLLHKICELNHFIMNCLQQKLDEDSPLSRSPVDPPKSRYSHDLSHDDTINGTGYNLSLGGVQPSTQGIINTMEKR